MLKKIAAFFLAMAILTLSCATAYALHNDEFWTDAQLYALLQPDEVSNCSLDSAFLKVKYDYDANRIYLMLMLSYSDYGEDEKSSVELTLNDIGTIKICADGSCEYDTDLFYAQADVVGDPYSRTQLADITIGIKQGIPDELVIKASVTDTFGIRSNDMEINITPDFDLAESTADAVKTTKTKTTKIKTTKVKTTKIKTTKTKKSKTEKSKTSGNEDYDEDENSSAVEAVLGDYEVEVKNEDKRTAIILGAVAAATVAATGCTVALIRKNKPKETDDEDRGG